MIMQKHSGGEWSIDEEQTMGGAPIICASESYLGRSRRVAKVLFEGGSEDPEVHANARLLVIAPLLFEACQMLPLDKFGEDMGDCDAADFVDNAYAFFEAMKLVRQAFSKLD